jgi:flavin-dependent dehydrogenase
MKCKFITALILTVTTGLATAQKKVDICVYGGTSAGVIAAYTAKMLGKSVILIESRRHLGGLTTGGLGWTDVGSSSTITGLSRDFYIRVGKHYDKTGPQWTFEPHVATAVYDEYVDEASLDVLFQYRLKAVTKEGNRIISVTLENTPDPNPATDTVIQASMYIDCTYEGDLMAKAGVSYTIGREANSLYDETVNGVQLRDKHQMPDGVDPYVIPGDPSSGLLKGINPLPKQPDGSGDS